MMQNTALLVRVSLLLTSVAAIAGCGAEESPVDQTNNTADVADTNTADAPEAGTNVDSDAGSDLSEETDTAPDTALPSLPSEWSATAEDFGCLTEWRPVRGFWLKNALGPEYEDEAVRIAEAGMVEALPPGTIIQLVPQEAMAKLLAGSDPATGDWEFFNLSAGTSGTEIVERGGAEVSNPAGSCMSCHAGAAERDLVCENTGLCAAAAVPRNLVDALVAGDPRCD